VLRRHVAELSCSDSTLTDCFCILLQIIVRKVYHLLAMGLFVPVFFWDLQLLALSLAIAFAVLVLLEVLRCMRLPLLGQAVQDFMQVSDYTQPFTCFTSCACVLAVPPDTRQSCHSISRLQLLRYCCGIGCAARLAAAQGGESAKDLPV
jgi:hypothetical protein